MKNPPKRHRPRPKRQPPGNGRPSGAFREVVEVQHAAAVAGVDLRGQRPLEGHLASPEVAVLGRFLEKIDEKNDENDENPRLWCHFHGILMDFGAPRTPRRGLGARRSAAHCS